MVKGKRELVNRGTDKLKNSRASFLVNSSKDDRARLRCQPLSGGSNVKTTRRVIMVQTIPPPAKNDAPFFITPNLTSIRLTHEQFWNVCRDNPDLRLELTSNGELVVMPPAGSKTGQRNFSLTGQLCSWAEKDGTGVGFDSSTGFTLPNKAVRSPDASWVSREKWNALSEAEQERFAPLCPDFVVELRSGSDTLKSLQAKLQEYLENGAQLGWLIDPRERRVYIYRAGAEVEELTDAATVSADPTLPGFELQLAELW
jgi:Uma2 family endonuclease